MYVGSSHANNGRQANDEPRSPFVEALLLGDAGAVGSLVAAGADKNSTCNDGTGSSALHVAARLSSPSCIIELLKGDPKPLLTLNVRGESALHVAARSSRSIATVLLLVSIYGPNAAANCDGDNFIHVLLCNERIKDLELMELFSWLLQSPEARDLLNHVNNEGKATYDVAVQHRPHNVQLLHLLLRNGATTKHMIHSSVLFALEVRETRRRAQITEAETNNFKFILREENTSAHIISSLLRKRDKILEKESSKRQRAHQQEEKSRESIVKKEAKQFGKVRLFSSMALLQRIGKGLLYRQRAAALLVKKRTEARAIELLQRVGRGGAQRCVLFASYSSSRSALLKAASSRALSHDQEQVEGCRSPGSIVSTEAESPPAAEGTSERAVSPVEDRAALEETARQKWAVNVIASFFLQRKEERLQEEAHHQAACIIQASFRATMLRKRFILQRRSAVVIQNAWRCYWERMKELQLATDIIVDYLQSTNFEKRRQTFIVEKTLTKQQERIKGITAAVTQLVWRENFCSACRDIIFMNKRRKPPVPLKKTPLQKWREITMRLERYLLLVQFLLSLFLLIYMASAPRTTHRRAHNYADIVVICLQLVVACCLPPILWRIFDFAIIITSLVCAATHTYTGSLLITLFVLKVPFVARAFIPFHSGTRTFCRAVELTALYLTILAPVAIAGVGATVRGSLVDNLMLSSDGNWGRVFLYFWSSLFPQYSAYTLVVNGVPSPVDSAFPTMNVRAKETEMWIDENTRLVQRQLPASQGIICCIIILLYTWSATIVGTHAAIRSHYDRSDETKLKMNKHRFRNAGKKELLDAHRAANMQALGQQLDGVMWEADVRAAKEAVDASHYDHNANHNVHRFVRRVQDSVAKGNIRLDDPTKNTRNLRPVVEEERKWDCRNEDPRSRGTYDIEVIEAALGMVERKSAVEQFFERQWKGPIYLRESTAVVVGMLVMASIKPNLVPMEAVFSSIYAVELVLSLYFLRLDFILSHYMRLFVRIFCVLVGFIPSAVPFVALRCLRLVEGWSTVFTVPGMVRWGMLYSFTTLITMWMIAFCAALQFKDTNMDTGVCNSASDCLAVSLREMVLPAWTPQHVDPGKEAPVMALIVAVFQLLFIPFLLSIALHPLLQLSNFIGRFLRLVVQSLHKDVLDYLDTYLEGDSWYSHWRIKVPIPYRIITKLKLWVLDMHQQAVQSFNGRLSTCAAVPNFPFPQATFILPPEAETNRVQVLDEIICKCEFASFKENEAMDALIKPQRMAKLRQFSRSRVLHYLNTLLTLVSVVFLWVSDITYARNSPTIVIGAMFHLASIVTTAVVFPKDLTVVLTVVSCVTLFVSVVIVLQPNDAVRPYYCLRFISFLRIGQLQTQPFAKVSRFVRTYIRSLITILFPALVVGGICYIAELLRAQIFLVSSTYYKSGSIIDNIADWPPQNLSLPESILAKNCHLAPTTDDPATTRFTVVCDKTSLPGVTDASRLFAHYFGEDAYVYYSIFSYWLLPALCVSTCLAYLHWSGSNLFDTNRLAVNIIPSYEDPITAAGFKARGVYIRWVGNIVLIASLVFGCIISPSTRSTADDHSLFFSFEVVFAILGFVESSFWVAYSFHRCARSWDSLKPTRRRNDRIFSVVGDTVFLLAEVATLLYYAVSVPLSIALLIERDGSLLNPNDYALYFVTLRFLLVIRMLPRQYLLSMMNDSVLFLFASVTICVYFLGSASALADIAAWESGTKVTARLWRSAFEALFRQTFTSAVPARFVSLWQPLDAKSLANDMLLKNTTAMYTSEGYVSSELVFILATVGKALLATCLGLAIAVILIPLRTLFVHPLPPKCWLLLRNLRGGINALVASGSATHDDLIPEMRRKVQRRKFERIFTTEGIPSWALPHLLEELNICRPNRQRRFMYALEMLLVYLPISERRQAMVMEYMDRWDNYKSGAPESLKFSTLPVFPPAGPAVGSAAHVPNPYTTPSGDLSPTAREAPAMQRYISPLRLVQALALFELGFPADSSVGSKLWLDFFIVVQKMRAATLMQSLWRMYVKEKAFDAEEGRSIGDKLMIATLRRSFRKYRMRSDLGFKCHEAFRDALRNEYEVYNLGSGHYEVLNRLRGHYDSLQPPNNQGDSAAGELRSTSAEGFTDDHDYVRAFGPSPSSGMFRDFVSTVEAVDNHKRSTSIGLDTTHAVVPSAEPSEPPGEPLTLEAIKEEESPTDVGDAEEKASGTEEV